ncbi:hypothetical protein M441DRAFT_54591 [Trichoderma asperellum CBS 433.97]|uniref:Uncharacterized protein n=1 Tax=Trichoderma asperellum (strain ATCC 204424 / CBS 433.97 / NBRC 101777) TaxID=1042311 RepID=A0A2T3ZL60_TRIA4|nr:hypothetical protein M441DRAFT_54591 [Trichoderma asperellum CBS 433.97]PTB45539.1 hypothetical protein M441DRAFT_54591 [Trichoderma asperellum CBS 433.97]
MAGRCAAWSRGLPGVPCPLLVSPRLAWLWPAYELQGFFLLSYMSQNSAGWFVDGFPNR